jgi:ornithine carbamoyltransferase
MGNEELLGLAKKEVNVQHLMPLEQGVEALESILDRPHSILCDEDENTLYTQKVTSRLCSFWE